MRCFGRDEDCEQIFAALNSDRNLLMLAPRRIGKTVILNELQRLASNKGYNAVLFDVEGFYEEKDFFRQCCSALQEELPFGKQIMASLVGKLKSIRGQAIEADDWKQILLNTKWEDFAEHLLSHMIEQEKERTWLILVDELPIFLQSMAQKGSDEDLGPFLYSLRRLRQKFPQVRWVYAGSIGLDTVARGHNVEGALNDLHPFEVKPFSVDTAKAFIKDICSSRENSIGDAALDRIVERLGWLSPYYLQRITEDAAILSDYEIQVETVDIAMDRLMELSKRLYWANWREHLDRNFVEPQRGRLYDLLRYSAKSEYMPEDTMYGLYNKSWPNVPKRQFHNDLDTLVNDGYLHRTTNGVAFRMRLLREWWIRYVA